MSMTHENSGLTVYIFFLYRSGDMLLSVNGQSLEGVSHTIAVTLLKGSKGTVTLRVVSWPGTPVWPWHDLGFPLSACVFSGQLVYTPSPWNQRVMSSIHGRQDPLIPRSSLWYCDRHFQLESTLLTICLVTLDERDSVSLQTVFQVCVHKSAVLIQSDVSSYCTKWADTAFWLYGAETSFMWRSWLYVVTFCKLYWPWPLYDVAIACDLLYDLGFTMS